MLQLVRQRLGGNTPEILVGHSLGGKVVLEVLQQLADTHKQQGAHGQGETGASTSSDAQQLQLPQQVRKEMSCYTWGAILGCCMLQDRHEQEYICVFHLHSHEHAGIAVLQSHAHTCASWCTSQNLSYGQLQ